MNFLHRRDLTFEIHSAQILRIGSHFHTSRVTLGFFYWGECEGMLHHGSHPRGNYSNIIFWYSVLVFRFNLKWKLQVNFQVVTKNYVTFLDYDVIARFWGLHYQWHLTFLRLSRIGCHGAVSSDERLKIAEEMHRRHCRRQKKIGWCQVKNRIWRFVRCNRAFDFAKPSTVIAPSISQHGFRLVQKYRQSHHQCSKETWESPHILGHIS